MVCRGHILNTLSDWFYDRYNSLPSQREIWNSLEYKYKTKKLGTDKILISKYFEFAMVDTHSVLDQVHELQIIVSKLKELKVKISKSFQVGAIIAKLPPTWKNYRKKLLHWSIDLNLEELEKHLRIEEETRNRDPKFNNPNSSKAHFIEKGKFQKNFKVKNNKKFKHKPPDKACFICGKSGHFARKCRYKKTEKRNVSNPNIINMMDTKTEELVAMVSEMQIDMIT